jgi:hypothetical protein
VNVKIPTGDNEIITAYICKQVGMPLKNLLLGSSPKSRLWTKGNLAIMLVCYVILTQVVKTWFIRRFGE